MNAWRNELQELCEAVIEERLSAEQRQRLEQLVLENAEARRFYVEYLHQHASLHWAGAETLKESDVAGKVKVARNRKRETRKWAWRALLAASLLLGIGSWFLYREAMSSPVATLAEGKACRWDAGTLPTETGSRLAAGRLRLAEGIARIVFDDGAEVTLEAPAELELVSPKKCVLHAGRLIAKVPVRAIGFAVDMPTATLTDLGTEFGVNVRDGQTADVQVFNGIVDVRHRATGSKERLRTGRNRRFASADVSDFDPQEEKPTVPPPPPSVAASSVLHISTAMGHGKDVYVQPVIPLKNSSTILLLVKNTIDVRDGKGNVRESDCNRKAYIGIDLSPVAAMNVVEAQLSFTFTPTGMGFASEVPDATFAVYGLIDETLDDWNDKTMRWLDAPANQPGGAKLDPAKVVRLGTFMIAQGAQQGERSIAGPALTDFLNRDRNGMATFILVRETRGSGRADLVHGFAGKNHPHLPPPTLKLTVVPRN